MDTLKNLHAFLADIEKISEEILAEGVNVLADQDEAVDVILESHEHLESDQVLFRVREATIALLTDAQTVQNEIEAFAKSLARGETINEEACPFLAAVWYGDTYGESATAGLSALKEDLVKQLDDLTIDIVVNTALKLVKVGAETSEPEDAVKAGSPANSES